ncbi:MAG: ricin-type beta-trefoil lectin domain protein [Pseudomonadota bacterium]
MPNMRNTPSFALVFSVGLLTLVLAGFGSRAIFLPEYWPPIRVTLILHIVVTGGWFLLVVCQASLVRQRNIALHMRLGWIGVVLAVFVVLTGTLMIVELNMREFSWLQVASNAVNMVTFAILFGAAILWRKDRVMHMRLITFASLALITPAIARLLQPLGLEVLTHPVWLALCAVLVLYDWRKRRSVTRATTFGMAVSLAGFAAFAVAATLTAGSASAQSAVALMADPQGYEGRIRLVRLLDEPDGYCIDVPGGGDRVMLHMPAIAHTCHFDPQPDQVFRFNATGRGRIVWDHDGQDMCLSAESTQASVGLRFENCNDATRQAFAFAQNGELRLLGTALCLAVERTGPQPGQALTEGQDSYGRGRPVNPQYTHLARALQLAPCGDGDPSMQRWMAMAE